MKFHTFAGTELTVSQLCFGCWGVVSDTHWGERDESESLAAMKAAVDAGINFFDTAPMYGNGASESLLGRFLQQCRIRDQLVIASKIRPDRMRGADVIAECDATLQRLRTDYLDLYQTHWTDPEVPISETWEAMLQLKEAGKVRHIGLCNAGVEDLTSVLGIAKPLTDQLPYNLLWRVIERSILPRCTSEGIGVLVYSPLMHGILADKYRTAAAVPDGRARSRHFSGERALARHGESGCESQTFAALDAIRELSSQWNRPMSEIALSWVAQQPGVSCVIAGARNPQQVAENIRGLEQPLSESQLDTLAAATDELKQLLGTNADMWDGGENARIR